MEQLLKFTLSYYRDRQAYLRGYKRVINVVVPPKLNMG